MKQSICFLFFTFQVQETESSSGLRLKPIETSDNVTKVMLNVSANEAEISSKNEMRNSSEREIEFIGKESEDTVSSISETGDQSSKFNTTSKNIKKMSVVDVSNSYSNREFEIDEEDVSKQVNEIIDEAAKINEAKLNSENQLKNEESDGIYEPINEINNNNGSFCNHSIENKIIRPENNQEEKLSKKFSFAKIPSTEVPIQPIFNETRTFNFHEYSDYSLPTSNTSTQNTTETPSTGPESLITSDIEDGYKGNDLEQKRKIENNFEDSKEEFIESQFEFLQAHLDNKTSNESDDDQTINSIKRHDIISSTLITDKFSETYDVLSSTDKSDVINELTHVISCNRLNQIIKPNNELHSSISNGHGPALTNFQFGFYSNENDQTETNKPLKTVNEVHEFKRSIQNADNMSKELLRQTNQLKTTETDQIHSKTFTMPKQTTRSVSFHSTFPISSFYNDENAENSNQEATTPHRSISNIYLNQNLQQEQELNDNHFEPSIADTPSLQSIEIMKTILNSSLSRNSNHTSVQTTPIVAEPVMNGTKKDFCANIKSVESEENAPEKNVNITSGSTWKYQGPPAINFTTWGERPKSLVHIKSDNDYVVGGTSKISALQKRFSGTHEEFLPVVRGVYKKSINQDRCATDIPDSKQKSNSLRPSYEISITTLNCNANTTQGNDTIQSELSKSNNRLIQRVRSLNEPAQTLPKNQCKNSSNNNQKVVTEKPMRNDSFGISVDKKETDEPIFSQFTLRKTGFKEKILDECNRKEHNTSHRNDTKAEGNNLFVTAPKPPPIQKNILNHLHITTDPRCQLLDSIRNFNRGTLKPKCK